MTDQTLRPVALNAVVFSSRSMLVFYVSPEAYHFSAMRAQPELVCTYARFCVGIDPIMFTCRVQSTYYVNNYTDIIARWSKKIQAQSLHNSAFGFVSSAVTLYIVNSYSEEILYPYHHSLPH